MSAIRSSVIVTTSLVACASVAFTGCMAVGSALSGDTNEPTGTTTRELKPGAANYVDPGPHYGPVAEKRAGQVVLSSAPIAMASTDDSAAYESYRLGEPLYMRYFGAESPHNLMPNCRKPRTILRAEVNGEYAGKPTSRWTSFGSYDVGDVNTRGASSLSNDLDLAFTTESKLTGEREVAGEAAVRRFNSLIVPKLHDGENSLRVVVTLDCGASRDTDPIVAEANVPVTVATGGVSKYLAKYGTILAPSPHKENTKISKQILKVMRAKADWDNEDILGARVTSEDWMPIRNQYTGVVTSMQVDAVIVVHAKKEASQDVCRLFDMSYRKDPAGGPLFFAGTGRSTPIPCANAPK